MTSEVKAKADNDENARMNFDKAGSGVEGIATILLHVGTRDKPAAYDYSYAETHGESLPEQTAAFAALNGDTPW